MTMQPILSRAAGVKLLALDVDGVLTDGRLYFSAQGETLKVFNTLDGHGLKMLAQAGIELAIITGRDSAAVTQRAKNLGIKHVYQGVEEKWSVMAQLCAQGQLTPAQTAYVGDDLPDLPVLRRVGFAVCVPHAPELVKQHAHYVTSLAGGQGAVREVCDLLLQAQGQFERLVAPYLS